MASSRHWLGSIFFLELQFPRLSVGLLYRTPYVYGSYTRETADALVYRIQDLSLVILSSDTCQLVSS